MTEQLFIPEMNCQTNQMFRNDDIEKRENKTFLSSLALEVDDIFFSLRKADQVIRRELNLLRNHKDKSLKKAVILPIDETKLKKIIDDLPSYQILVDEYIIYMLESPHNSIFQLIKEYNGYLEKRKKELDNQDVLNLINIDEKLVHYIRQLGAMIYHLNIHLNLLSILLKNTSLVNENQQITIRDVQDIVTDYLVNQWGEKQQDVRFLEVTIDGAYAIVTWAIEDFKGDAIVHNNEGYWQLMNISAGIFELQDFENAAVPLDVAQRMLRLHHQKLGY
ncbi:MAG: hypothetical protein Fur006_49650 [Coleofasciculaceae cyanobacterium]